MLSSWINSNYLNPIKLSSKFKINKPFPHLVLENFFNQEKLLAILKALTTEEFQFKDSDLFSFFQTNDFCVTNNKVIKKFRDFLASTEFINYLSRITSTNLQSKMECFATIYQDTNYLLPHDDRAEGRKIAYMIYLSNLDKDNGGELNFYSSRKIPLRKDRSIKSFEKIIPQFNTFIFFEVSKRSFHSVSEVVGKNQRIAISGWFYDQ